MENKKTENEKLKSMIKKVNPFNFVKVGDLHEVRCIYCNSEKHKKDCDYVKLCEVDND